ncbi:MAPEG family protein [Bowmanella pacifica]|uniref:Membrane protein n=1 Tax=Bowmanella pacifica TaxID=502051 RepID=A0A918DL40_9ALTE|nr:MAPEG family protein [Bowmanella pacifica]GGO70051.1 membrane protein [Bowmanella pacifica]
MISLFYTGWLLLLVLWLSIQVIRLRRLHQIAIGDGGYQDLQLAIRAHANALEYLPLALLLIFMLEQQQLSPWFIHAMGLTLLVGRIVHATAIPRRNLRLRVMGMAMTFLVLLAGAILAITLALSRL